ncbi:TPR Domain containing protein [Trichomonas vaginalis G3]|uniref:TPR Domain containing protein n=1 Tax=Trichomonas vaginalis (strain ATCC PRA-98 / G3) TaxID=412133 RepID=A2F366_TRIV3|nr:hypothetical protein TVAGG3_0950720 [Trichomonas vaginalis G3]EAY00674.1 TPR Domain containing protein [Trichomonas vaginalis G3]KAI5487199.1 hypothetical protein TVAGG3_0950720 [Trichomonas vaginalis G3]|eukprot:XP_001313603.1 TPR Domain containing protein [Trichomonas vaginalis G3]
MEISQQAVTRIENDPVAYFNEIPHDIVFSLFKDPCSQQNQEHGIYFAIDALYLFIVENFTGPSIKDKLDEQLLSKISSYLPADYIDDINVDGEMISTQAKLIELIWIAYKFTQKFDAPKIWIARAAMILQRCLPNPTPILKYLVLPNASGIELPIAHRLFHNYQKFFEELDKYRETIKFEFKLTGKLGKKTKFQQESKSQFILEVQSCQSIRDDSVKAQGNSITSMTRYKREVALEEDANLLDRPNMDEEFSIPSLTTEEMAFLIQEARAITERNLGDEIRDEKAMPILTTILQLEPKYSFATAALFDKSRLEQHEHSLQPRAALQLQSIIDDFAKDEVSVSDRLSEFFMLEHPPLWEVKREMGLQMMNIGAARTAAQIFIDNKMWDELAICCVIAKDNDMGIDVLKNEKPTPQVLTILGELKKDKSLLEEAWKLSRQHYSRAQRSLADFYLADKDYQKAAEHYEIALKINPLFPQCWHSLGCCFMRLENFEKAISSFQEVISQKGDDSECFSNLAICFSTIGKNDEAHKAITQAVRFQRENIKIWENFIVISINAGKVNDAITGIEEVSRVERKWCNTPLIYEVINFVLKEKGDMKRVINAMEKISQNADCGFDFWTIYADIAAAMEDFKSELEMRANVIKALEGDEKIMDETVFNRLSKAVEKYVAAATRKENGKEKTAITRLKVILRKYEDNFATLESYKKLEQLLEDLQSNI